jgi:hypothetical protein
MAGQRGNRSRTGMGKPPGSGEVSSLRLHPGDPLTSFTLNVRKADLEQWRVLARVQGVPLGGFIRGVMADLLEEEGV